MKHFHTIRYENIKLRPLEQNDIESLRIWRNAPENTKYLSKIPFITKEMQEEWFRKYLNSDNEICLAIDEEKDLHRFVGNLSLHDFEEDSYFLGHVLIGDKKAHGKEIVVNASIAATKIAFEQLDMNIVKLYVFPENIAAYKVYKKAGFQVVDIHKNAAGREEYTMTLCKEG